MFRKAAVLVGFSCVTAALSCGTAAVNLGTLADSDMVSLSGVMEVLHSGTRSETVIITDEATGEVFALVGDNAVLMTGSSGMYAVVLGRRTDEGYSVREDLPLVHVTDFSFPGTDTQADY